MATILKTTVLRGKMSQYGFTQVNASSLFGVNTKRAAKRIGFPVNKRALVIPQRGKDFDLRVLVFQRPAIKGVSPQVLPKIEAAVSSYVSGLLGGSAIRSLHLTSDGRFYQYLIVHAVPKR